MNAFRTIAPLVLASASPRRRDFLSGLGLEFAVQAADLDETPRTGESPEGFVRRLAREKALAVAAQQPDAWVLAADTVVAVQEEILGKPRDAADAEEMLMRLSGRWHGVWTGFSVCCGRFPDSLITRAVRTGVRFMALDRELCRAYVRTGEPLDKAGAYGIQGTGAFLVEEIRGSYTNVVGLPLAEVLAALRSLGVVEVFRRKAGALSPAPGCPD